MEKTINVRKLNIDDFRNIRNEWELLLDKSSCNNIFLTWEWIYSWRIEFNETKELCILEVRRGNKLIGIAPFYFEKLLPLVNWRILKVCGSDDLSPDYLDIIAIKENEKTVVEAVFKYLFEQEKGWVEAIFDNVLDKSNIAEHINICRNQAIIQARHSTVCPYLAIEGTFDQFLKKRFNRKKRYNLQRQVRILLTDKKLSFHKITSEKDLPSHLSNFFKLHAKRLKEKNLKSTFNTEKTKRFLLRFSKLALEKNSLGLYFLFDGNEPVCGSYCLIHKDKLYYYQSGIEPAWQKFSLGTTLLTLVIQECFSEKLLEFDFLKGAEEYKKTWMTGERIERKIVIYRKSFLGFFMFFASFLKQFLRGCLKNS